MADPTEGVIDAPQGGLESEQPDLQAAESGDGSPDNRSNLDKRFGKLTAEKYFFKEKAEALERELAELRSKFQEKSASPTPAAKGLNDVKDLSPEQRKRLLLMALTGSDDERKQAAQFIPDLIEHIAEEKSSAKEQAIRKDMQTAQRREVERNTVMDRIQKDFPEALRKDPEIVMLAQQEYNRMAAKLGERVEDMPEVHYWCWDHAYRQAKMGGKPTHAYIGEIEDARRKANLPSVAAPGAFGRPATSGAKALIQKGDVLGALKIRAKAMLGEGG